MTKEEKVLKILVRRFAHSTVDVLLLEAHKKGAIDRGDTEHYRKAKELQEFFDKRALEALRMLASILDEERCEKVFREVLDDVRVLRSCDPKNKLLEAAIALESFYRKYQDYQEEGGATTLFFVPFIGPELGFKASNQGEMGQNTSPSPLPRF